MAPADAELPTGACGFRDLSIGSRAPSCGCRRFWLDTKYHDARRQGVPEPSYCFCGHHACFHETFPPHGVLHRSRGGAPSLSIGGIPNNQAQRTQTAPAGLGIQENGMPQSQSISTRLFDALNGFAREQAEGPPSIATSQMPSTAAPSIAGDMGIASARDAIHHACQKSMGPPVFIPQTDATGAGVDDYSATEVATPSIRGTPDLQILAPPTSHNPASPNTSNLMRAAQNSRSPPAAQLQAADTASAHVLDDVARGERTAPEPAAFIALSDMARLVQALRQRVEVLESLSFSHVPLDEVHGTFELIDGRLADLEQWRRDREEVQVAAGGPTTTKRHRVLPAETDSFSSEESYDSAAAAHTEAVVLATLAANEETGPRIDALESRIEDLEHSAPPSLARPWEVQVVLLPWGPALRGVWFSALDSTRHSQGSSTQPSQEWSGAQPAASASFTSTSNGGWTTASIQAWANGTQEWLSPKACGPSGAVFQRLESRGFVRNLSFTAPDSGHILNTISNTFNPLLRIDKTPIATEGSYQGLNEVFIPLRKVRQSTRLRFLGHAEMITSANWTAGLLSSVMMKVGAGQRRLYVTTHAAYTQVNCDEWTWPRIRGLPMDEPIEAERAGNVIEACWTFNPNLDQPVITDGPFAAMSEDPVAMSTEIQSAGSDAPTASPLTEVPSQHPRTVSLPNSAAGQVWPKRRIASFETTASASASTRAGASKRRRISTSPEAERRGVGLTPRMSREPPSPHAAEYAGEAQSQATVSAKRGLTPFAYATPHSLVTATNAGGRGDAVGYSCGDAEIDADEIGTVPQSESMDEDEWHGVADDTCQSMSGDGRAHEGVF